MMEQWEAVVIGGGLAGGAVSIELAKAGKRVLLIEKESRAHDKICGEFISIEAQNMLSQMGIDLNALNAERITHVRIASGNNEVVTHLPFCGMSLSRRALDEALLIKAEHEGVTIRRGVTATGLTRAKEEWIVHCNQDKDIYAGAVFLSTGKHDLRGFSRKPGIENNLIGFKMHFYPILEQRQQLSQHVELILFNEGYVGLELVENGIMNICLVVSKSRFASLDKSWGTLLRTIANESPLLHQRIKGAQPLWPKPLAIFGIPYGLVYEDLESEPNMYRLGDQMAVIPSFCGDGMAIALTTARLSVHHYLKHQATQYHKTTYNLLVPQIQQALLLSSIIKNSFNRKAMIWICKLFPGLIRLAFSRTRVRVFLPPDIPH